MPQTVDAGDSGHVCHGKGVKKYEVQSVDGHENCLIIQCLWQQNVVGVRPAMVEGISTDDDVEG